jgi:bifunctional ADP-heptose synthase (sugar kinase/adenylyltransferase)
MKSVELLDRIMQEFTKLQKDAKISETVQASQNALKIIDDALLSEYKKGCVDTTENMAQLKIENQIKNN